MVILAVVFLVLFFEPYPSSCRPYNMYTSIPCPFTCPANDPAWSYDVTAHSMQPINLIFAAAGDGEAKPAAEAEAVGVAEASSNQKSKSKCRKKDSSTEEWAALSAKLLSSLLAIPGSVADTLLNGQILI